MNEIEELRLEIKTLKAEIKVLKEEKVNVEPYRWLQHRVGQLQRQLVNLKLSKPSLDDWLQPILH